MSERTVTEQLRSVLRARSDQAPEPEQTVLEVLARTSGPGSQARPRPRFRMPLVAAAAVLVLVLAGAGMLAALRQHSNAPVSGSAARLATPSARPATPFGGNLAEGDADGTTAPAPPAPTPPKLDCSAVPAGRVEEGHHTQFTLSTSATTMYAYDFRCVGTDGARSASSVVTYALVNGRLQDRTVLFAPDRGYYVDSLAGSTDSVVVDGLDSAGGSYLEQTFATGNGGLNYTERTQTLAGPCIAAQLQVRSVGTPDVGNAVAIRLQLTNRGSTGCALSGYPEIRGIAGGRSSGTSITRTLAGPAGGVREPVAPIVRLNPGDTATAILEPNRSSTVAGCRPEEAVSITLPTGAALTLRQAVALCGRQVHPFVFGQLGSG